MSEDRQEELASLYAFDLLERDERLGFEQELARNHALQSLVRDFRATASALVYTAPAVVPPPALKSRVLTSILATPEKADAVVQPSPLVFRPFIPWAIAACLALAAAWMAQLYVARDSESSLLRDQAALAELALESARQQLEAERIIARQQVAALEQQVSTAHAQLADARAQSQERERQFAQSTQALKTQVDLARLKITALASLLDNSPKALAIAVWDPAKQEGVLQVEKLPALLPNQDYQLWVVDPQYPNPVDGGVFTVRPETGEARHAFKVKQPVAVVNAFAVTLERKGGVPKAEGPFVLLGK